jgi:hypothetical protein
MNMLLNEADKRGFRIYRWNIFDVLSRCEMPYNCQLDCPVFSKCLGAARETAGFYSVQDFIEKASVLDDETFKAQWLNEKPASEGLFYREFDRDTHVISTRQFCDRYGLYYSESRPPEKIVPKEWPRLITFDWGYEDPTCWIQFAYDRSNDVLYGYKEYYVRYVTAAVHAKAFQGKVRDLQTGDWVQKDYNYDAEHYWIKDADPEGAEYIAEFASQGIKLNKALNRREYGFQSVRERFSYIPGITRPRLVFFDTLTNTIEEHENLRMKDGEVLPHSQDHTVDLVRYASARLKLIKRREETQGSRIILV